jgi:hypothetical protein
VQHISGLRQRLQELAAMQGPAAAAAVALMRKEIERHREGYFTYRAVLQHIARWLADPWQAELWCTPAAPPDMAELV